MALKLEEIGLDQEALQDRVVSTIADKLLHTWHADEDDGYKGHSWLHDKLTKMVQDRISQTVSDLAEKHVLPNVSSYIEKLALTETNRWGEKKGQTVTFIEYLVQRADQYMREQVDFKGKSKDESDGYSWKGTQTRITYLVHQHLHYSIQTAMETALQNANNFIVKGIEETTKIKLRELAESLTVAVTVKK